MMADADAAPVRKHTCFCVSGWGWGHLGQAQAFHPGQASLRTAVPRAGLQVGVTSMLVASKYEEIYAPAIDEFCYITDNTYTREQVGVGPAFEAPGCKWPCAGGGRAL